MKSPLRILHLKDDLSDAEHVRLALESQGVNCAIRRIQTHDDLVSALERGGIDLVLSNFSLSVGDRLSVSEVLRSRWPTIPLILVFGSLDEELIADSLKTGVTDWIPKGRLSWLAPAVRRAMHQVEERSERRGLEAQAIESQKMEVISQLTSGMAHDFNNILAVILGYSDLLTSALAQDSPLQKYTEEIRHASNRATGLTRAIASLQPQTIGATPRD